MKYLITGTKGFIGSNLIEGFPEGSVVSINEDIFNSDTWISDLKDILNLEKPVAIFHVGACSDTLEEDVNYMMTRNYESTKILSDWSNLNSVPLIYSSSAACYGSNGKHPSNLYGWSKYQAEDYVIKNGGVALRYFNVYGHGEQHKGNMASLIYQAWLFKKSGGSKFKLFPNKPSRDFVYIKDVVSANLYALNNYSKLNSKFYDVGCGESRNFEDIMTALNLDFEYKSEEEIPSGYQFFTLSDRGKWMDGWESKWTLERGISEYITKLDK